MRRVVVTGIGIVSSIGSSANEVQMIGGMVLHKGGIAEMRTGE
eukprot:gene35955-48367_t